MEVYFFEKTYLDPAEVIECINNHGGLVIDSQPYSGAPVTSQRFETIAQFERAAIKTQLPDGFEVSHIKMLPYRD